MNTQFIDAHIHVGHFQDRYFDPAKIAKDMRLLNVDKWIFSSTSTGNVPFEEVKQEIETVLDVSEGKAYPFLWVTPEMLKESKNLKRFLFCRFYGIKIHGYRSPWEPNGKELRRIFSIAREMNLPIKLHTGGIQRSGAGEYLDICSDFNDVRVILAHGRPLDGAISVMLRCPNVYADTAFMPNKDIKELVAKGFVSRILFGTDYPITSYFYSTPSRRYYKLRTEQVRKVVGEKNFEKISNKNFAFIRRV